MSDKKAVNSLQNQDKVEQWFPTFVEQLNDHLKADYFMLQTQSAPKETYDFFKAIMENDQNAVLSNLRQSSSIHFIKNLIVDYLQELKTYNKKPLKLALGLSDSKILVWSEINDGDEDTEDALLLTEAKINGKYHPHGFYINSTIIEKSDNLPIPPHYQTILK